VHPLCAASENGCVRWETAPRASAAADLASLQRQQSTWAVAYLTLLPISYVTLPSYRYPIAILSLSLI